MYIFNRTKLNVPLSKTLLVLLAAFVLSACDSTRSFEDAGVYKGENYTIDITRVPTGISRTTTISINGEQILTISGREEAQGENCQQMSFYVSQCTFDTQYEGKAVRVVLERDGKPFQQAVYYSVYFDGALIRKVSTPFLN